MISWESSTFIARPAEDVFAYVADVRNDPNWHKDVHSATVTKGNGQLGEGTVFDVAAEGVDRELAISALERAQLGDLVDSLPAGLDAQVGERGALLSGGQRQRLGIARALYRQPRLLVLDEATSSLDNETEHEISQAIRTLSGSVSVIVVAHRLSTVRNVDRILFLKHGRIALIEPGQPVFVIVPSPRQSALLHSKVVSNIQEIRARGARVIAVAEEGDAAVLPFADEVLRIPLAGPLFEPLLAVVPLHIFAMGLATAKGLDVDQPRNLAKSVTVE